MEDTKAGKAEQWAALREPFPAEAMAKLPKPLQRNAEKGRCNECGGWHGLPAIHLDYVGHAEVTDRLLAVDPEWNWEPVATDEHGLPRFHRAPSNGQPCGLWIKLTVCGVTRLGYGSAEPGTFEPEKQLIGDALRNAAMRFGVALDLWSKSERAQTAIHDEAPATGRKRPQAPEPERHPVGSFDPDGDEEPAQSALTVDPDTGAYREEPTPALHNPGEEWLALVKLMGPAGVFRDHVAPLLGGRFSKDAFVVWMAGHPGRSAQVLVETVLRQRERQGEMAGAR